MIDKQTCSAIILDIFLKTMGNGFTKILFLENENDRGENTNNFKQKIVNMKKGDQKAFHYVYKKIVAGTRYFWDWSESEYLCERQGSDKYLIFGVEIWPAFSASINFFQNLDEEQIFNCPKENLIAYILTKNLASNIQNMLREDYYADSFQKAHNSALSKDKKFENWEERCFRKEYYNSFSDTLKHAIKNKTFYKWPIEEFKKITTEENFDSIMQMYFGEGCSNIEKMKYERGVRKWTTFEKLFKNEQNKNDDEMAKLKKLIEEKQLLPDFQIFQSRIFAAYFWENLRSTLPDYIQKENAKKIWKTFFELIEKGKITDLRRTFKINLQLSL